MEEIFMFDEDFLLLEADDDDALEVTDKSKTDDTISDDTDKNKENNVNKTKQNNNEEESDGDSETDDIDSEVDNPETKTDDNTVETGDDIQDNEEQSTDDDPVVEDEIPNSKRLFFYNNFDDLYNTTISFIDKLDFIKNSLSDDKKKEVIIEIENKLLKQKTDINFLLKKKIMNTNEENLDKLLLYFSTKTETIIDIAKSLIKEVN